MSSKPETTFYTSVHKHLPESVYRMKTHNPYIGGIPDCWYSGRGGDLWIEYKFVVLPKRDTTLINIDVSSLQSDWLRDRYSEGRTVAVIVGCKEGGVIFTGLTWETEISTHLFKHRLKSRKDIADFIRQTCLWTNSSTTSKPSSETAV